MSFSLAQSSPLAQLKDLLRESNNVVFFGGAGVSTESGIPDFRSETGIFATQEAYGYRPETIISHSFFMEHPDIFFNYYRKHLIFTAAQPNAAHKALVRLEQAGKLQAVITQNIDGLHQLAGSMNVLELHGSVLRNYCMKCHTDYDLSIVTNPDNNTDTSDTTSSPGAASSSSTTSSSSTASSPSAVSSPCIPRCSRCGGMVRPDVVLYEEGLDSQLLADSIRYISAADVLIVGGTSLNVYPAAGLITHYPGKKLVLINKGDTPYDTRANLRIKDSIGKVLEEAICLDI